MKSVILSGGKGTRLFPLSRERFPKQYLKLFNSKSLFQLTAERAEKMGEVIVITNEEQKFIVRDQLEEIGVEAEIIVEPESKNTFPAIILASIVAKGNFFVLPSDHLIEGSIAEPEPEFFDYIVTFGIRPRKPYTGYGYIKPGERIGRAFRVEGFVEKPEKEKAEKLIEEGWLWNSGIFAMNSEVLKEEVERFYPGLYSLFEEDFEKGYRKCPEISFDHALMEKTDKAIVIPLDIFWSDVGSFDSLFEVLEKDKSGNALKGNVIAVESRGNLILTEEKKLAIAVGVEDLLIANTKDVLLVCRKGFGERIREVVRILKEANDSRAEYHTEVHRPWGVFHLLERNSNYWIKRIVVKPKAKLSLQRHMHRSEHWIVLRGMAKVIVGEREYFLKPGESTFVPAGVKHRIENPGIIPLEVIEVGIGDYLSEEDIERFEDEYGR